MVDEAEPMAVDAEPSSPKLSNVSLEILEIVSTGQREHGMKHRDYARYRAYCARRLARLYKTCKMKHGKGRFVQQPLVANAITDERTLLVPVSYTHLTLPTKA